MPDRLDVICVKRKIEDDCAPSFVLRKKARVGNPVVFTYAGSSSCHQQSILKDVNLLQEKVQQAIEARSIYHSQYPSTPIDRKRKDERYTITPAKRIHYDNVENKSAQNINVFTVDELELASKEDVITCNGVEMLSKLNISDPPETSKETYDIYYRFDSEFDPINVQTEFLCHFDNAYIDEFSSDNEWKLDDDDDSNDENYWRNDYPEKGDTFLMDSSNSSSERSESVSDLYSDNSLSSISDSDEYQPFALPDY